MRNEYDTLMDALVGIMADPTNSDPPVPSVVDVQAIRNKTGLPQAAFARRIGVSVGTLRNWEQGHRFPTGPARVLLALLGRNPRIVEETLRG
jgi:putative transcriptional regulator